MTSVDLPEVLDRRAAARLAEALLQLRGVDLDLQAAAFKRMGAQGAEVLLAAEKQWREDGVKLGLLGLTPQGREAFTRLGLAPPATPEG